jgi:hypothetical protein
MGEHPSSQAGTHREARPSFYFFYFFYYFFFFFFPGSRPFFFFLPPPVFFLAGIASSFLTLRADDPSDEHLALGVG